MANSAILLVSCPDQKGIEASIADFIFRANGNILHADDHQDREQKLFLMRVEWDLDGFAIDMRKFGAAFQPVADRFQMKWRVALSAKRPRVAILISKYTHCLVDLLYRHETGELACEIPLLANHPDAKRWADFYKIPLHVIPVATQRKHEAEQQQLQLLRDHEIDLVILGGICRCFRQNSSWNIRHTTSLIFTIRFCRHLWADIRIKGRLNGA